MVYHLTHCDITNGLVFCLQLQEIPAAFIKCMRDAGLPIEVLVKYVRLYNQGDSTLETRRQLLIEQRDILVKKISSMNETLEKLNFKITNYSKYSHDLHEAFKKK